MSQTKSGECGQHERCGGRTFRRTRTSDVSTSDVELVGRNKDVEPVITKEIADQINQRVPNRYRIKNRWELSYSLEQHGISLKTMLRSAEQKGPMIIAIKDTRNNIFGAFINESLKISPNFYGNGTCFLWKVNNAQGHLSVKTFTHTKKDDYFILCDPSFVAIGGGEGCFGLWFQSDLLNGRSTTCPTFNNEALCIQDGGGVTDAKFSIKSLELWAL